jgi:hypothetical protein
VWRKPDDPSSFDVISKRKAEERKSRDTGVNTQAGFEPGWMSPQRRLIAERLSTPNPWCESIRRSLKIKEPPLPYKKFSELQPGDVILMSPDRGWGADPLGNAIRLGDRASSWEWQSPASHTLIFVREINGKKLFLDNRRGEGPRIKTQEQVLREYERRDMDVAQPLGRVEAESLWAAAREAGIRELRARSERARNLIDKTGYGLYGDNNMVCSEASHWVLANAGYATPHSDSRLKKLFGIYFGPANFYSQEQHFLVTPLAPH